MLQVAISQALYDSQLYTLNMLKNYVNTRDLEQKSEFITILDDFYTTIKNTKGSAFKKKKEPSEFNMFIRDKIIEIKAQNPEYTGHDLMRKATLAWKEQKNVNNK